MTQAPILCQGCGKIVYVGAYCVTCLAEAFTQAPRDPDTPDEVLIRHDRGNGRIYPSEYAAALRALLEERNALLEKLRAVKEQFFPDNLPRTNQIGISGKCTEAIQDLLRDV